MAGKAQMANAAQSLLLLEVVHDAPPGVQVGFHGLFIDIVEQIEVKILHPALFQLFLEDFCGVVAVAQDLVAGILGGEIVAASGVVAEDSADDPLGLAVVIGIGRVEIVYTMPHGIGHHFFDLGFVNGSVGVCGQAHGAKAQQAELQTCKLAVNHRDSPSCLIGQAVVYYQCTIR